MKKQKRYPYSFTEKELKSIEALLDSVDDLVAYSEGTSAYRHDCKRVSKAIERNRVRIRKEKQDE